MTQRILYQAYGGPDVLRSVDEPLPPPARGEVRVRHTAVGVNYIDVYERSGAYTLPLPSGIGYEAAGVVEEAGPGVDGVVPGQRVAYVDGPAGAYAEARNVTADRLVPLPDAVPDETAATLLFKGLTAHMLLRRLPLPERGSWVLVHAAAGGVGRLLTRWLAHEGARVIGVVGSEAKVPVVRGEGAEEALVVPRGDYASLPPAVRALTSGRGVRVVYDSVGRDSFEASLASLAPFGLLANYGRASGPLPLVDAHELGRRGSIALQRPSIFHHVADPADLRAAAAEVFDAWAAGILRVHVHARVPLTDAARAHALLESRDTSGALVLIPRAAYFSTCG